MLGRKVIMVMMEVIIVEELFCSVILSMLACWVGMARESSS